MIKIDLAMTTYEIYVTAHEFLFRVEISSSKYANVIESIRCKDDKDIWRDLKYSIKKEILADVESASHDWIRSVSFQSPSH